MVKLFGKKRKDIPRKRIKCHICGLEKEMTWAEYIKHIKRHIKNGDLKDIPLNEVQPTVCGELVGSSEGNEARISAVAKGKD